MKNPNVVYLLLGIFIGYQLSRQIVNHWILEPHFIKCQFYNNDDNLKKCRISELNRTSSILLTVLLDSPYDIDFLKEIYSFDGHLLAFYARGKDLKNESQGMQMLRNVGERKLNSNYDYYAFLSDKYYLNIDRLVAYFNHLRVPKGDHFLTYFSDRFVIRGENDDEKLTILLEQSQFPPLVIINQYLLNNILDQGVIHGPNLVVRDILQNANYTNETNPFVKVNCSLGNNFYSLPVNWAIWCFRNRNLNTHVVHHILSQNSLMVTLESHMKEEEERILDFQNLIPHRSHSSDETQKNLFLLHDVTTSWKFISNTAMVYSTSVSSPVTKMKNRTSSLVDEISDYINQRQNSILTNQIDQKSVVSGYTRVNSLYAEEYIFHIEDSSITYYMKIPFRELIVREYLQMQPKVTKIVGDKSYRKRVIVSNSTNDEKITKFSIVNDQTLSSQIVFIVPYCCRPETLKRFLTNVMNVKGRTNESIYLIVIAFEPQTEGKETYDIIWEFFNATATFPITLVQKQSTFQRGMACQVGSSIAKKGDLLFFIDVDMEFQAETLDKIRWFTIEGRQVYYPMIYSRVKYHENWIEATNSSEINDYTGYWRNYGFGMLSIFKSDFDMLPGYSTEIKGWGGEDVDLADKIANSMGLDIHRSADPSFAHIHHEKSCNKLELGLSKKYDNCVAVRYLHLASPKLVSSYLRDNLDAVTIGKTNKNKKYYKGKRSKKEITEEERKIIKDKLLGDKIKSSTKQERGPYPNK